MREHRGSAQKQKMHRQREQIRPNKIKEEEMRERQDIKGARNQRARKRRAGNQNEIRGDDCKHQASKENELRENEIKEEAGAETQIMEQATSTQANKQRA